MIKQLYARGFMNDCKWMVFFSLALFVLFNFIQLNMMNVLSVYIMQLFGINAVKLGFVGSAYFYTNLIFTFFSGILLDLFSPKKLVIGSIGISLLGLIYFIIIPNILSLVIWRLSAGVTCAFTITGAFKIISKYFHSREIGTAIGLIGAVATFAGIVSQTPLSLVLKSFGFNIALLIIAGIGFFSICLIYIFVSHDLIKKDVNFAHMITTTRKIFFDFKNLCVALFACFINLPLFILGALWGSVYLIKVYDINSNLAAVIVSMLFLGHMIGAPIFGFLTDRVGSRRLLLLSGAFMALISVLLINLFSHHFFHMYLLSMLFLLLGISTDAQVISWAFVIENNRENDVARAVSLVGLISVFGGVVFQPIFGLIVQHGKNLINGYQQAMLILVFTSFFAFIFSFYIPNRTNKVMIK